jgi:hypothetical protein
MKEFSRNRWGLFCAVLFFTAIVEGRSQTTPPQAEQANQFRVNPNLNPVEDEEEEGEESTAVDGETAPASPGDSDIGVQQVLKRRDKLQPFTLFGDFSGFYTSNVALAKQGLQEDAFYVGTVGASWQPRITNELLGEVTVKQQFFRYDQTQALDFNSLNIGGGLTYVLRNFYDLTLFNRFNFQRLTDGEEDQEFYKEYRVSFGAQKVFPLAKAHYLFVGAGVDLPFSDPYVSQRYEYSLYGGYHLDITRDFQANVFYRIAAYDYAVGHRDDLNNNASIALTYEICDYLTLTGSFSAGFNNSNQPVFDYEVYNSGGGLTLKYKF